MTLHFRKHHLFITTLLIVLLANTNPVTAQDRERCVIEVENKICNVLGKERCPPCWVPQSDHYVCQDKKNGRCLNGVWDRESELEKLRGEGDRREAAHKSDSDGDLDGSDESGSEEDSEPGKLWCRPGNTSAECRSKCPLCWQWRGTYYACYDKKDGRCPSAGMKTVSI